MTVLIGDDDVRLRSQSSGYDVVSQRRFDLFLNIPLQRSCPVDAVESLFDDDFHRRFVQRDTDFLPLQALVQFAHEFFHDLSDDLFVQRIEIDDIVDSVQKFRFKMLTEFVATFFLAASSF